MSLEVGDWIQYLGNNYRRSRYAQIALVEPGESSLCPYWIKFTDGFEYWCHVNNARQVREDEVIAALLAAEG